MAIDWAPFVQLVQTRQNFLLTTHVRPDGDGLGSMMALAEILENRGKQVRLVVASVFPERYRFLDPRRRIERFEATNPAWPAPDVVVVLDTGTWNQLALLGQCIARWPSAKVVIDHHPTQDELGAVRLVDTAAEATGRLVFEAIAALGERLPEQAAQALFVALAMDTGWFRHSNTSSATFALAAELVRAGARQDLLYQRLFEDNSLPRLKLLGLVLERLQVTEGGRVAHTEIRRADYAATGAVPQDSEDMVNYTLSLAGVEVGLLFMEQPRGGVKISFRSRARVDVGSVAERFGGGGHRLASGTIVEATLEEARKRVLEALAAAMATELANQPDAPAR
jgi:phosphoesterase RecJ-like protein